MIPIATVLGRILVLAACWWAITEGERAALGLGLPTVILAAALSLQMQPRQRVSFVGLLRFVPFFLWRSLGGGIDVARRVLAPKMRLEPRLMEFRTQLPAGTPRVVFANAVSLVPGTLCADLKDDVLLLHTLSEAAADDGELRKLEQTIARVFP